MRLSPEQWDNWYRTGRPTVVSHKEAAFVYDHVALKPGTSAVDLACGTGQWTRQLAAWGLAAYGFDFSTEALRQASAAASANVTYARWDIDSAPIPHLLQPRTVDLVTCRYALPYLQHGRLMTDIGRWLTPDGTFYALVRLKPTSITSSPAHTGPHPPTAEALFHRGFTEEQIHTLGAGWASQEVYSLSPHKRVIILRGYGQ
ncbi:class I SAM-dependent methyltransferase [Streptomyces sasae]|uniref:class I SAM-dependent methyltransferase n=1 Tax=Streptomyces sasae TaxID=1266772 RepID=UPI002930AE88|nr:class I SAM-dependent methyltransferase [Streptomyces sasae]